MPPTISRQRRNQFTARQLLYARCTECAARVNWIHSRGASFNSSCCGWSYHAWPISRNYEVFQISVRQLVIGENVRLFRKELQKE